MVRDRGQATVEFALLLPLVVVLVLCLVQLVAVVSRRVALETTTWNLTRAATVAVDPTAAARAALDDQRIDLEVTTDDRWVTVVTRTVVDTDVPVVGRFFPAVTLESRLTMLLEPPLG
ncbi:MAG: TadE/TadG family type IV pilus assembly protein [Acidimicrobiia bacterium]